MCSALLVLVIGGVAVRAVRHPGGSTGTGGVAPGAAGPGRAAEPGPTATGAGATCPAARQVPVQRQRSIARLVHPPQLAGTSAPTGPQARAIRQLLLGSNRHALRTLYPSRWADAGAAPLDDVRQHVGGARSAAAEAFALAVSTETGAFDPAAVGRTVGFARGVAVWLVRSLACRHAAVSVGGWGAGDRPLTPDLHEWQSPLWAMHAGLAGWLLWRYLGPTDRYRIAAMVLNEADRLLGVDPQYQTLESGRVRTPGDTKAEENAWTTTVLALAAVMFPEHPHRIAWRRQEIRFALAAYATRVDTVDNRLVHAAPLRSWLDGWNVAADGTVVNHGRVHPAYASSIAASAASTAVHGLAGMPAPRAVRHGLRRVYRSLLDRRFPAPPFAAPGGTVYRPGSGQIYLPQGNDWGTRATVSPLVRLDAAARVLGIDERAAEFELRHAGVLAAMQARSWDGRSFQSRSEQRYLAAEELEAENIGRAWLLEWAAGNDRIATTDDDRRVAPPIAADDRTGRTWTRYPAGATTARRTGPTGANVLAPSAGGRPARPAAPRVSAVRRAGSVRVGSRAGLDPGTAVDVLVPVPGSRGYLLHVPAAPAPGASRPPATVVRLGDGRRSCVLPVTRGSSQLPAAAPPGCFDDRPIGEPTVVTTVEGRTAGAPLLAVAVR